MRALLSVLVLVVGSAVVIGAQGVRGRVTTDHQCAASLGTGVKTKRSYCDVLIGNTPGGSVVVPLPPHTGSATLAFDLHNRFGIPVITGYPGASYTRHEAVIRLVGADGGVLGHAAVIREFRTTADLFDQLGGGNRPGGVRGIAPGPPEPVRFTVPEGVDTVGIAGESLRVRTATGTDETYDAPGRPVAIVSNVRLEYRPAR